MKLKKNTIDKIIDAALAEDRAGEDITSSSIQYSRKKIKAFIISKQSGIVCGLDIAERVFKKVFSGIKIKFPLRDGDKIDHGSRVAEIKGPPRDIFAAERVALNFLSHLSGIATLTRRFVKSASAGEIYDTRKTLPGLREAEKYAVRTGGGKNHRLDLASQVLIKENHIAAAKEKDIKKLVENVKGKVPGEIKIEVEVETLSQLPEVLESPVDIIMLDNFSPEEVGEAKKMVRLSRPQVLIEVSGGITLKNIHRYAFSGIDRISVGAITNASPPVDFSLLLDE